MPSPFSRDEPEDDGPSSVNPSTQLSCIAILRGFDPESGIASFSHEVNGLVVEKTVAINKKRPLYSKLYEILISSLGRDGKVPALNIRVSEPNDDSVPELLFATPAVANRKDQRFNWRGTELRWSDELDMATDVDFDWKAQQFANGYVATVINKKEAFDPIRAKAREIFVQEAGEVGIVGSSDELGAMFDKNAAASFSEAMGGREFAADGAARNVRYDSRYNFSQQRLHVTGSPDAVASALANYSCQRGIVECGALAAAQSISLGNGKSGSLAQAHQHELVDEKVLLAPNPNLESYAEIFTLYTYDQVRTSLRSVISGAMDVAGIQAARPDIDFIEHEKKNGDPDKSYHLLTQSEMSADVLKHEDPAVRAGAYLMTASNIADGFRERSMAEVAAVQARTTPNRKTLSKDEGQEYELTKMIKSGIKKLDSICDMV